MMSPKRRKNMKFNKVGKHNFKYAKKLSVNKSINDYNNNLIYAHTPNNKKEKRRRSQISSALKVCKNIEENYPLTKNKDPLKTMKKMHSTNKIQMIKFIDLIHRQKSSRKKEEKKNETNNQLPIILKLDQKDTNEKKKFTSSNNIAHIFKNYTKVLFRNNSRKSKNKNNNDFENENTNYDINNVVKIKKKKKESKENIDNKEILEYKHKNKKEHKDKKDHKNKKENHENKSKNEVKEDKKSKLSEENVEDEKDKNLNNKVKCKFFCCL